MTTQRNKKPSPLSAGKFAVISRPMVVENRVRPPDDTEARALAVHADGHDSVFGRVRYPVKCSSISDGGGPAGTGADERASFVFDDDATVDVALVPTRTTGLFPVPTGGGNTIELVVMISYHGREDAVVEVTVSETTDGIMRSLFRQQLTLTPRSGQTITWSGVEQKLLQVWVTEVSAPAGDRLWHPSVSVTETFLADGAVVVVVHKAPGFFVTEGMPLLGDGGRS